MAEVDTDTGTERISRTLALDATGPQVRELLGPLLDGWTAGVHVVDPRPGLRLYVLPLIEGVVARWDLLLAAHRRRTLLDAAADALDAMGEGAPTAGVLAEWLAAGADEPPPVGRGEAFVLQWRSRSLRPSGSAWSVAPSCSPGCCPSPGS